MKSLQMLFLFLSGLFYGMAIEETVSRLKAKKAKDGHDQPLPVRHDKTPNGIEAANDTGPLHSLE